MQVGEYYRLVKPTFLHKGVLILQNSKVELLQFNDDGTIVIEYLDKEMNPHSLTLQQEDIASL